MAIGFPFAAMPTVWGIKIPSGNAAEYQGGDETSSLKALTSHHQHPNIQYISPCSYAYNVWDPSTSQNVANSLFSPPPQKRDILCYEMVEVDPPHISLISMRG